MGHQSTDVTGISTLRPLWQHKDPTSTRMDEFRRLIEEKHGARLPEYESLRQWSIQNLSAFWEHVWDFTGIVASTPFSKVGQASRASKRH